MTDNQTCKYCGEWTATAARVTYKGETYLPAGCDSIRDYHDSAACVEMDEPLR